MNARRPCAQCGEPTRQESGVHQDCEIGLAGGQWVQRGPTLYWQPNRKSKGGRPSLPAECGTERGYQKHRHAARKGATGASWPLPADDPCGCRAAHREHEAARVRALTREHRPATKEVA